MESIMEAKEAKINLTIENDLYCHNKVILPYCSSVVYYLIVLEKILWWLDFQCRT